MYWLLGLHERSPEGHDRFASAEAAVIATRVTQIMITYRLESVSQNNEITILMVTNDREEAFAEASRLHARARAACQSISKLVAAELGRGVLGAWRHETKKPGGGYVRTVVYRIRRFHGVVQG
jgi:hypothetical protein